MLEKKEQIKTAYQAFFSNYLFVSFYIIQFLFDSITKKPAMVLIVQQEQILEPGEVNLSLSTTIFEMQDNSTYLTGYKD